MFSRFGLSRRLNIIIISINVAMLIIVAFLANSSSATVLRNQAITRFDTKTEQAFASLEQELLDFQTFAHNIAAWSANYASLELTSSVVAEIEPLFDEPIAENVYSLGIMRPNNTVVWMSPANIPELRLRIVSAFDVLEHEYFQTALTAEETWFTQETAVYDSLQQATITVAVPYQHETGHGLVWLNMLQSTFDATVLDILNQNGLRLDTIAGYTLVLDEQGEFIDAEGIAVDDSLQFNIDVLALRHQNANRSNSGLYRFGDPFNDNQTGLFSIHTFDTNNWQFISIMPESEIPVVPADIYLPIIFVGILGIIVLMWMVNRFIANAVVQPLNDLGRSATEIGQGNMRFVVFHQDKSDEIGQLAQAMSGMRERLRETYSELEKWSNTLEDRVQNRTEQLADARLEAEQTATQLQAVYDESLFVVNEAQLRTILDAFIDRILQLLDSNYCAIWLLTDDRQSMRLVATNDIRRRTGTGHVVINANQGIVGQAIIHDSPIIVNDYADYEHRLDLSHYYENSRAPFNRAACAPLKFGGYAVGSVVIGRSANSQEYDLDDQRQLTLFTNIVSPSVRNAQLFAQLQEAVRDAERANNVKTRFLASVTHELRTPLNLIINNMDFMSVGAFGEVNDEQRSRLHQTLRSAEHLLYLINDLLDVSKIEAGEMQLFIQDNEVYTMLEDAVDNAYALLDNDPEKRDKIEIRIDVEEHMSEVPMDARRIRQVLNNLLSNAIKFTEEGTVTLKVFQDVDGIHFSVHDTGMGIPQNELPKLFEAFVRTDAANEQAIEGTGLGLPISRYLVQEHGTDLVVISQEGVGTTFAFSLPFNLVPRQKLNLSDTQEITAISPSIGD